MSTIEGVTGKVQQATNQAKFQITQAYPAELGRRINLTDQIAAILSHQDGEIYTTAAGQRQQGGNYTTSIVYDTSINQPADPRGKVAISVTKTATGWSGSFQLYPGGGAAPEVLKYNPAPYSNARNAQSSAEFAAEMVSSLRSRRYDLFKLP
jgi:hypothetical protein